MVASSIYLRDARQWMDARDRKMLILGPCNEWTEGSYIEPCAEFGFGMLDAVRRVFCEPGPEPARVVPGGRKRAAVSRAHRAQSAATAKAHRQPKRVLISPAIK